jgi:hypothetical protein
MSDNYTGEYTINDLDYGTQVEVTISGGTRIIQSNAIANHATGEFPNKGNPNTITEQDKTFELTLNPIYVGKSEWARENGVAYNGVKYELQTAELVSCESGEEYRIEAIQTAFSLGLDENNAHVQPTGEYHYHGVAEVLMDSLEGTDIAHIGYASDGFPLYYSKQGSYTPSFQLSESARAGSSCSYRDANVEIAGTSPDGTYGEDWEYIQDLGNLDACNGAYVNGEYGYFITEDFPYGPRCMNGDYSQSGGQMGPPSGGEDGERRGPPPRQ